MGILWYPIESKILSSFGGIVFHIRNIILLGSTTKQTTTHLGCFWGKDTGSVLEGCTKLVAAIRNVSQESWVAVKEFKKDTIMGVYTHIL